MKRKIFILLVMVIAVTAITALSYQDALASARGIVTQGSASTMATCDCRNCTPQLDEDSGIPPQTSSATCLNGNGTTVSAWVRARTPNIGDTLCEVVLNKLGLFKPSDWGWGKGDVTLTDTTTVELIKLTSNTYRVHTQGKMTMDPGTAVNAWIKDEIKVYDKNNPGILLFSGTISLTPGRYDVTGDYIGLTFTYTAGNPATLTYNNDKTITFNGNQNDLVLNTWGPDRGSNVPTTTQWGVIILASLLVTSAVYIMIKRRKVAVVA